MSLQETKTEIEKIIEAIDKPECRRIMSTKGFKKNEIEAVLNEPQN